MFGSNPILRRELLSRLRSWKTLAALLTVAGVSSGLVLLRWPTDDAIDVVSQGAMLVFRPLAFALSLAVMMLVPAFPATSLVTERRSGTLALLLNSPASPLSIYWGKLASNVLLALVLLTASLPAVAACMAMGGISLADHILPLAILMFAMVVQYSAVGLWVSLRSSSSDASLRWTYVVILALAVLSMGPLVWIGNLSGTWATVAQWLTALSPISALQQITGSQAATAGLGMSTGLIEFIVASAVVTLGLAVLTVRQLDPLLLDRAQPVGKIVGHGGQSSSLLRRLNYLVDPQQRSASIPWWLNPVMVKEFRTRKFGRLHWLLRLVALCAIISLLLTVFAATGTITWGVEKIAGPLVLMQLALMLLVGPSLGANLLASEVESGGWQLLRATPFPPLHSLRKIDERGLDNGLGAVSNFTWLCRNEYHPARYERASRQCHRIAAGGGGHGSLGQRVCERILSHDRCRYGYQLRCAAAAVCRNTAGLVGSRKALWTTVGRKRTALKSGRCGVERNEHSWL